MRGRSEIDRWHQSARAMTTTATLRRRRSLNHLAHTTNLDREHGERDVEEWETAQIEIAVETSRAKPRRRRRPKLNGRSEIQVHRRRRNGMNRC